MSEELRDKVVIQKVDDNYVIGIPGMMVSPTYCLAGPDGEWYVKTANGKVPLPFITLEAAKEAAVNYYLDQL